MKPIPNIMLRAKLTKADLLPKNYGNHCHYCGTKYKIPEWPRECDLCTNITYLNPIPVAVGMLPLRVFNGEALLLVKRAIKPHIGGLCFPGGFVDYGETWQEAISREIWEETSIETDPSEFDLYGAHSTPEAGTRVLLFGLSKKVRSLQQIDGEFRPSSEVKTWHIGRKYEKLCFSLHQEVFDKWSINGE
jgi:ADP-ribose pyrophosphatase YjhB (NUDIX family)